ncbi:phosphatidylglycerophosphatase Gep4p, mitochondrial [Trichomonascus vanleenenianus]|uniref:phosphatidylglycerophosphatase n=1 Tax=Trichomonascus vanleenenianus TaxID=2268995 RepID=UPI003ECBAD1A
MNISGTVNALRLLYNPSLFLPQVVVSNFGQLPVPIPPKSASSPKIGVVVLDKDNCFAEPHKAEVFAEYLPVWQKLKDTYGPDRLLIVSNTAGSNDDDGHNEARILEQRTGVKVFKHTMKKPGCHYEIVHYLKARGLITSPEEVAVVGDRLMTDVLMANIMGAQSVWVKDGVVPSTSVFTAFEQSFYRYMTKGKTAH